MTKPVHKIKDFKKGKQPNPYNQRAILLLPLT